MNSMKKCPKPGCKILIPLARHSCTKHWHKLSWREQEAWMRRNDGTDT